MFTGEDFNHSCRAVASRIEGGAGGRTVEAEHCSASTSKFGQAIPGSISSIIRCYKAAVTKQINLICNTQGYILFCPS